MSAKFPLIFDLFASYFPPYFRRVAAVRNLRGHRDRGVHRGQLLGRRGQRAAQTWYMHTYVRVYIYVRVDSSFHFRV